MRHTLIIAAIILVALSSAALAADRTTYKLQERAYLTDTPKASSQLWVAGCLDCDDHGNRFADLRENLILANRFIIVPPGTEFQLTGRSNGVCVEITLIGTLGKWVLPIIVTRKMGIPDPPFDQQYNDENK